MSNTPRNVTGWLPNLIGPLDLQGNGESVVTRRATINFVGAEAVDNPELDRTDIITGTLWRTAFEVDFTALDLSTVAGNGAFAIGDMTAQVINVANASAMSVGGADGLMIDCNANNSVYSLTTRTGPAFIIPLSEISDEITIGSQFRVWVQTLSSNLDAATEQLNVAIESNHATSFRQEFLRYHDGSSSNDFMRLISSIEVSKVSAIDAGSTTDCRMIEIPRLGLDFAVGWTGNSVGGTFPPQSGMHTQACIFGAAATGWRVPWANTSEAFLHLGASTGNTSNTLVVKYKRIRVDVRTLE